MIVGYVLGRLHKPEKADGQSLERKWVQSRNWRLEKAIGNSDRGVGAGPMALA